MVDGKVVSYEPFDLAGDALGHAGETSEVFWAWPRRLWLSCRDHRSDRAAGSSLVQGISDRNSLVWGKGEQEAAPIVLPSPYGPRMQTPRSAPTWRPTGARRTGAKGNATTEVLDQAVPPAPPPDLARQDDPDRDRSGPGLGRLGRAEAGVAARGAAQVPAPLRRRPCPSARSSSPGSRSPRARGTACARRSRPTGRIPSGATGASGPSGPTGANGVTEASQPAVHVVMAEPQAAPTRPTAAPAARVTAKAADAVVSRPLASPAASAKKVADRADARRAAFAGQAGEAAGRS